MSTTFMSGMTTGGKIYCPTGADVVAPNILWNGINMLPAGAVMGDEGYWTDYSRPANSALAIAWIERQIGEDSTAHGSLNDCYTYVMFNA